MDLMSSMNANHFDIENVTYFVLHVIYNRPKREKSPGDSCCAMLYVKKDEKKVYTYKITAARSKFLNYENIASTFS